MNHSPEPWLIKTPHRVDEHDATYEVWAGDQLLADDKSDEDFEATLGARLALPLSKADMERVVACVNFLAAVPTDVLQDLLRDEERRLLTHNDPQSAGYDPHPCHGSLAGLCRKFIQRCHELNPHLWIREGDRQDQ
jgi:hypothetical protein